MKDIKTKFINTFKEIASIPRPSGHTEKIRDFVKEFASNLGYNASVSGENLIITIPATDYCKSAAPVILQGHLDMVATKKKDIDHDFLKDGLNIKISEDKKYLYASGTSLGADDGFAICYILMLMQEQDLIHPKLYLILTSDEETGCQGVSELDFSKVKDAKYMFNLDCESEGFMPISSATAENLEVKREYPHSLNTGRIYDLRLEFENDAHPVTSIEKNAIQPVKIMSQILFFLVRNTKTQLCSITSDYKAGTLANSCSATILTEDNKENFNKAFAHAKNLISDGFSTLKEKPFINSSYTGINEIEVFNQKISQEILYSLMFMPTGVLMRENLHSTASIAVVSTQINSKICTNNLQLRANSSSTLTYLKSILQNYFYEKPTEFKIINHVDGWKAKSESPLLKKAKSLWREKFASEIITGYSHGFLETGCFQKNLPDIDIISFGPTVENIHSSDEKIDLDSAVRVYEFLIDLLKDFCPVKTSNSTIIERTNGKTESVQTFYKKRNEKKNTNNCILDCPFNEN